MAPLAAPWERDTIVTVSSTTKGVASLAVAGRRVARSDRLRRQGGRLLAEFAQAGKGAVTVGSCSATRPDYVVDQTAAHLADIADPEKMSKRIAAQAPLWPPGTRHGYHAITLGWYESELIRHADPQGRTLGRYFAEEIAAPLDLDFYIGLPLGGPQSCGANASVRQARRAAASQHGAARTRGSVRQPVQPGRACHGPRCRRQGT